MAQAHIEQDMKAVVSNIQSVRPAVADAAESVVAVMRRLHDPAVVALMRLPVASPSFRAPVKRLD